MIRTIFIIFTITGSLAFSFSAYSEEQNEQKSQQKQPVKLAQPYNFPGGVISLTTPKKGAMMPTVKFGLAEPVIIEHTDFWQILIGIDLETIPGQYVTYVKQSNSDEPAYSLQFEIQHRGYPAVAVDKLPEFIVTPDTLSDIDFINSAEPQLPLQLPAEGLWDNYFGYVMIASKANSKSEEFSTQQYMSLLNDQATKVVIAPQDGVISRIVETKNLKRYIVYIDHGRGLYSIVCGLSELAVELGDGVVNGAVIGKFNSANNTTEANIEETRLRWQVVMNGVFVDPVILTKLSKTASFESKLKGDS